MNIIYKKEEKKKQTTNYDKEKALYYDDIHSMHALNHSFTHSFSHSHTFFDEPKNLQHYTDTTTTNTTASDLPTTNITKP